MSKLLTLAVDNEAVRESKTNIERTRDVVDKMLTDIADGVDSRGRSGLVKTQNFFELTDGETDELRGLLREKSVLWGTVKNDGRGGLQVEFDLESRKKAIEKFGAGTSIRCDVFVKISIIEDGRRQIDVGLYDTLADSAYCGDVVYIFSENELKGSNPFRGKRFYEIEALVAARHGIDSEVLRQVDRVVDLCRAILYENMGESAEEAALSELKVLKLSVGQAANAIIQDFDRDFSDNEGWEEIDRR